MESRRRSHIHRASKEGFEILNQGDMVKNGGVVIEVDQEVDVTFRVRSATGHRPEYSGVPRPVLAYDPMQFAPAGLNHLLNPQPSSAAYL